MMVRSPQIGYRRGKRSSGITQGLPLGRPGQFEEKLENEGGRRRAGIATDMYDIAAPYRRFADYTLTSLLTGDRRPDP
jgi:hypothetical protein